MSDGKAGATELNETASQAILGPNPFIGIRNEDVLATAGALAQEAAGNPTLVLEQQAQLVRDIAQVFAGKSTLKPAPGDKRFADPAWAENPFLRMTLGGYLAWTHALGAFIDKSSFDDRTKERARFVTQLVTDALSPSNTFANPVALRRAIDTGGTSIAHGLRNMVNDVVDNNGMPSMVDKKAFKVGENLALTPGSVVFRSDVLELIHYRAQTEHVYELPYLIVPPQINKYYVFDLSPEKSMIDFLVKGGIDCYAISWRNPKASARDWNMDTYVGAIVESIAAVRQIAASPKVNVMGACAGGMTLAALLGYYAAGDPADNPLNSATLLVSVLDGEADSTMFLFVTPDAVEAAKANSRNKGVLEGSEMSRVFAWLRPNDLIWNYWVNNYLVGNSPPAFDILYWNGDTTRLPAAFHAQLLDAYVENSFKKSGALEVLGRPIDLRGVTLDAYFVAGITDHITPWRGVYNTMRMFGGKNRFVLSAAGHIQSLVNPPAAAAKREYFLNPDYDAAADDWLAAAKPIKGSWWGDWLAWIQERSGSHIPAPASAGSAAYPALVDAPGTYVLE
jgi:polyhydroxyalkanoate synthase